MENDQRKKAHYFYEDGIMATGKNSHRGMRYTTSTSTVFCIPDGTMMNRATHTTATNTEKFLKTRKRKIDGVEYVFSEDGVASEAKSALGSSISEAALAQVGTIQDCTMLVTNGSRR